MSKTRTVREHDDAFVSTFGSKRGGGRPDPEPYSESTPERCAAAGRRVLSAYAPHSISRPYEGAERCDRDVVASDLIANIAHQIYGEHPEDPIGAVAHTLAVAAADLLSERVGQEKMDSPVPLVGEDECIELLAKFKDELRRRLSLTTGRTGR